jgi:hypothetical protein
MLRTFIAVLLSLVPLGSITPDPKKLGGLKVLLGFVLLLLAPLVQIGMTQDTAAPNTTGKFGNGRLWSVMSAHEELAWATGYRDGLALAASLTTDTGNKPTAQTKQIALWWPNQLSYGEAVQGIDHFYQDTPENAPVPIADAAFWVRAKATGASQLELDTIAASDRKASTP